MPKPLLNLPRLDDKRAIVTGANSGLTISPLDLADLASVREFVATEASNRLDILVNNAGIMADYLWASTEELAGITFAA